MNDERLQLLQGVVYHFLTIDCTSDLSSDDLTKRRNNGSKSSVDTRPYCD